MSDEDQGLLNLVTDCLQVGKEVLCNVDALLQGPQDPSRFQSVRRSLKIKFNERHLEAFVQRLQALQSALSFDVVLSLLKNIGQYHNDTAPVINSIGADVKTIITRIEGSNGATGPVPSVANGTTQQNDQQISNTIQRCMEKLWKETIENNRNGQIVYAGTSGQYLNANFPGFQHQQPAEVLPLSTKEKGILNMLKFRQMYDRFEEISPACRRTFEWIFYPPSDTRVWDDFAIFLNCDNATKPYWVNGKAASGKSTLLKFILEHQKTRRELLKWAQNDELLIIPFFFWNLGTTNQKSQNGLLRALLYPVFKKHPDLIRFAFPSLWEDWKASDENYEPSYSELKKGFTLITTQTQVRFKICVIVDGVDELEGDHEDLASFLKDMVSPRIKVIISSRPIPSCVNVFGDCPSLKLQNLTKDDIRIVIEEHLYKHRLMKALEREEPEGAKKLVEDIRERADGVFLWVKLVVKLLIQGMRNRDQISDLQGRLQLLPRDLKDLYSRMFGNMESLYLVKAAEIFQIIRTWREQRPDDIFSPLMLSFAVTSNDNSFKKPVARISLHTAHQECRRIESWIRSRCCGLVELREHFTDDQSFTKHATFDKDFFGAGATLDESIEDVLALVNSSVQYLHKSVADFLYSEEIWQNIRKMTESSLFDARISLARASLLMLKIRPPFLKQIEDCSREEEVHRDYRRSIHHFTVFLGIADTCGDNEYLGLLSACDETLTILRSRCSFCVGYHWSYHLGGVGDNDSLLTFAICFNLYRYISLCSSTQLERRLAASDHPLFLYAMYAWEIQPFLLRGLRFPRSVSKSRYRSRTLEVLLQRESNMGKLPRATYYWNYAINNACLRKYLEGTSREPKDTDILDSGLFVKIILQSDALPSLAVRDSKDNILSLARCLQVSDVVDDDVDADSGTLRATELGLELEGLLWYRLRTDSSSFAGYRYEILHIS